MIQVVQLGTVAYAEAEELQRVLVERRKCGATGDVLLLLEHPPVITLGRNAKEKNIIASTELLAARGIDLHECNRGGDVTYHGPGQLVGYPIVDLRAYSDADGRRRTLWPVEFVRMLEEVLMGACGELGVPAQRLVELTGVWTQTRKGEPERKLAAIGVHISRGVTSHGFALNVTTDLDAFNMIVPCGISDKPVTSLRLELQRSARDSSGLDVAAAGRVAAEHFARVFHSEARWTAGIQEILPPAPGDVPLQAPRELKKMRGAKEAVRA